MRKRKPVLLNGEALMVDGKVLEFDAVDQEELDGKIDAPQVAQVGEVLTVEKVDEDGKPIKWKAAKVSGTFVCTFNEGEDGWITCDKTVEEIITANNDGKDVIGHYYGEIYRLSTPLETGGGYGNPMFSNLGVGVLSIIQYDGGHFGINRIRLSDIAPEDIPNSYEVPVYVPTRDGMQWQYGRPLLATDYVMNELTDEEKALMQKNLGINALSLVKYTEQELTDEEQVQARKNIRAKPIDFPVTITSTTTDGVTTYTADKTFAEIKAAYDSGANVYAVYRQGIVPLSGVYNDISAVFYGLLGEIGGKIICNIKIDSDGVELEHSSPVPCVEWNNLIDGLANTPYVLIVEGDNAPDHGGLLFYYYGATSSKLGYKLFTYSGNLYTIEYDRRNNYISSKKTIFALPTVSISDNNKILQVLNGAWTKTELPASLPSPATAQVGQIVKVKAVDESGKITETEAIPHPVLYVTISKTGNTNTSDKTFAEIKSAYDSGCSVFAVVDTFVLPLLAVSDNAACFCATTPDGELHRVSVLITESSVSLVYGSFVEGNQGVENAGKILGIDNDGNVVPEIGRAHV